MTHVWIPNWGRGAPDMKRCRASVHDGGRMVTFHQCTRKVVVRRILKDGGEYGFCAQHDPVVVEEKTAARDAKWRAEWDERDRQIELRRLKNEAEKACIDALRQIANGHNDARSLAIEVIAKLDAIVDTRPEGGDAPKIAAPFTSGDGARSAIAQPPESQS